MRNSTILVPKLKNLIKSSLGAKICKNGATPKNPQNHHFHTKFDGESKNLVPETQKSHRELQGNKKAEPARPGTRLDV